MLGKSGYTDLQAQALQVIKSVGLKAGQAVLDLGCGSGTYTIPAAKMTGSRGTVYALDKDNGVLDDLMQRADSEGLTNIERMDTAGGTQIALANDSIDVVLLFDILHCYYFSSWHERQKLLTEIYRILKPNGLLSVYPKHMETEAKDEIESADFNLETEHSVTLIHNGRDLERGQILNFRKKFRQHTITDQPSKNP